MQHSTQIAREWVREPIKCAQTFDGIYLRFIDCYPERVPKGNPIYDAGVREIPPREDLQGLKLECVVLRGAYRLAQPRQPKLTVPIEVVNNFFDAIVNRDRAAVRTAYSEFAGYVSDMHRQLQIDEPELSPAEFVRCLADDVEKGTPSDELTLSGSQTDDELRDRYRCDYLRLAGKPLGELPQVVLTFAVGLWEKVGLPTIEMEVQSLRLVIAKYIQRLDSIQGGNSNAAGFTGRDNVSTGADSTRQTASVPVRTMPRKVKGRKLAAKDDKNLWVKLLQSLRNHHDSDEGFKPKPMSQETLANLLGIDRKQLRELMKVNGKGWSWYKDECGEASFLDVIDGLLDPIKLALKLLGGRQKMGDR